MFDSWKLSFQCRILFEISGTKKQSGKQNFNILSFVMSCRPYLSWLKNLLQMLALQLHIFNLLQVAKQITWHPKDNLRLWNSSFRSKSYSRHLFKRNNVFEQLSALRCNFFLRMMNSGSISADCSVWYRLCDLYSVHARFHFKWITIRICVVNVYMTL